MEGQQPPPPPTNLPVNDPDLAQPASPSPDSNDPMSVSPGPRYGVSSSSGATSGSSGPASSMRESSNLPTSSEGSGASQMQVSSHGQQIQEQIPPAQEPDPEQQIQEQIPPACNTDIIIPIDEPDERTCLLTHQSPNRRRHAAEASPRQGRGLQTVPAKRIINRRNVLRFLRLNAAIVIAGLGLYGLYKLVEYLVERAKRE